MNDRIHYLEEREPPYEWAKRVWASWTPSERGEFVGAVEIIMESNRGAGTGTPARKRRRDKDRLEFKPGKYPFYRYRPELRSDHMGRWD